MNNPTQTQPTAAAKRAATAIAFFEDNSPKAPALVAIAQIIDRETQADIAELSRELTDTVATLRDLIADAKAMDKRLLAGQPDPLTAKGSVSRAESRLACMEAVLARHANPAK
jgi:hypothetical protein